MLQNHYDQELLETAIDILRTLIDDDPETHDKERFASLIDKLEVTGEKYIERRTLRAQFGLELY